MNISFIPKGWGALKLTQKMEWMMRRSVKQGQVMVKSSEVRTRDALIRRSLAELSKEPGFIKPTQKAIDILQEEARLQGWAEIIVPAIAKTP